MFINIVCPKENRQIIKLNNCHKENESIHRLTTVKLGPTRARFQFKGLLRIFKLVLLIFNLELFSIVS